MNRIFWLASYPKSGNTWLRLLIANLTRETPADINAIGGGGIASARGRFDATMLFPSGLLSHDECDRLRPRVHAAIAERDAADRAEQGEDAADDDLGDVRFVKTHDAWTLTENGEPLMGGRAAAEGAILIVRDPRDVAASLANHNRQTIDEAIGFMADPLAAFCSVTRGQANQLRQQLPGWSGFQTGWIGQSAIPVHVVRYEDIKAQTARVLRGVLDFAKLELAQATIDRAVRHADFAALRAQERAAGFREAPPGIGDTGFFRRGVAGGWRDELTAAQARRVEADHADAMAQFGYRA